MSTNDFQEQLNKFRTLLVQELPVINEKVALNAYAMVNDRVVNEGKKADGSSLGTYSTNELPLFFYNGKTLNNSGDAAIAKAKKEHRGMSYSEFREANNRPTDHVTLSFSGDMFRDIGVIKQLVDGNKIITTVGAKNTKTRISGNRSLTTDDIMEANGRRYGDFLQVNVEEEARLANTYDVELQKLIDKGFK